MSDDLGRWPAGSYRPGELIPFTVTVKPTESKLSYKWSVSGGTIADGQGTSTIQVKLGPDEFHPTATVEIGGLSDECPKLASESLSGGDGLPLSEKLDTFLRPLGPISDDRFKSIAAELNKDPTSQLYVLVPSNRSALKPLIELLDRYTHSEVNPMRVTFVEMNGTNNIVEVWLVPPGAKPPSKCEACDESKSTKPDCPAISITGPAGITSPGETMTFTTYEPIGLQGTYKWSVSKGGRIESGQGTPSIKVLIPTDINISNITATVELSGLDATCPYTASETAFVSQGDPLELDTYGRLSRNDEKARLAIAFNYIRGRSPLKAVVAIRVPRNSTTVTYASRRRTISTLFRELRASKTRYVLVDAGKGELSTSIWIVPAESVPAIIRGIVQ